MQISPVENFASSCKMIPMTWQCAFNVQKCDKTSKYQFSLIFINGEDVYFYHKTNWGLQFHHFFLVYWKFDFIYFFFSINHYWSNLSESNSKLGFLKQDWCSLS